MKNSILVASLIIGCMNVSAQDGSKYEVKARVSELNKEFKELTKDLRREYDEQRQLALDSQQDELEETYWKNRLELKRDKKRFKRQLKSDPNFKYQFTGIPAFEILAEEPSPIEIDSPRIDNEYKSDLIASAEGHIGVPYRYGGTDEKGFDCSGFVQYVFSTAGHQLPRTSQEQVKSGKKVSLKELLPGDLIFFSHRGSKVDHVGIVTRTDNGRLEMIHSSSSKGIILTEVSSSTYWYPRLKKARRIS